MIDRSFLRSTLLNYFIQRMIIVILMREINENIIKSDKFIIINVIFKDFDNKKHAIKNVIIAKLHVINDFNINLLLNNDVLNLKNIIVDLKWRKLIIKNCESLKILIKMKTRKTFYVKRII